MPPSTITTTHAKISNIRVQMEWRNRNKTFARIAMVVVVLVFLVAGLVTLLTAFPKSIKKTTCKLTALSANYDVLDDTCTLTVRMAIDGCHSGTFRKKMANHSMMTTILDIVSVSYPCTRVVTSLGVCLTYAGEFVPETGAYIHQDIPNYDINWVSTGCILGGLGIIVLVLGVCTEVRTWKRNKRDTGEIACLDEIL
jgi:hypothetical protein